MTIPALGVGTGQAVQDRCLGMFKIGKAQDEALRGYSTDRGMSFPAEVLIVSGTKNRPT